MSMTMERVVGEIARTLQSIERFLPRAGSLEKLLTPADVAELLRVEVETLEAWRSRGHGPSFLALGSSIRYRPSEVLRWLDQRVCRSTWDAAQVRGGAS